VAARAKVTEAFTGVEQWFGEFAGSLGARTPEVPATTSSETEQLPDLVDAWGAVRRAGREDGVFAVLRLLWAEEWVDDLRALEADLVGTAARLDRSAGGITGPVLSWWRSWPARDGDAIGRCTPRRPIRG